MNQNQIQDYAGRFAAQTVQADPPTWVEPTDHHLARVLGVELQYDECTDIRHRFLRTYSDGGYGPMLAGRQIDYRG